MSDGTTVLAIGDVHLGTSCSGLPDESVSLNLDAAELSPAAALDSSVGFAIRHGVRAVLFAGDVVESTNSRFEAMRPLESAVRRLLDAGIEVIAVAGNHDVEALPRLARLIEGFTLLGEGGRWESHTISNNGLPVAEVVGWSFGDRFVRESPVARLLASPLEISSPGIPRIGLLHADLDASGGHYAPVRQVELDNAGFDAWLLGHIHRPSLDGLAGGQDSRPSGYLGSLVGLDPSETGPHGPWILKVSGGQGVSLEQVPLAPLRWENISVPVDDLDHAEDVPDRLLEETVRLVRRLGEAGHLPRALGLRVRLTGSTHCYDEIRQWISRGDLSALGREVDGTAVFFNKITDAMELELDLAGIASGDDPAALMARRLLILGQDDDRSRALLEEARERLSSTAGEQIWSPVLDHRNATDPLSDDALRELLLRAGKAALSAMMSGEAP